jgi:hypothetical protein
VQQRLKERAKEVNEMLQQKAYFYVCGDAANMAREVNAILAQILAEQRGITETKAEDIVKNMRAANQYQVRRQSLGTSKPSSGSCSWSGARVPFCTCPIRISTIDGQTADSGFRRMYGLDNALPFDSRTCFCRANVLVALLASAAVR